MATSSTESESEYSPVGPYRGRIRSGASWHPLALLLLAAILFCVGVFIAFVAIWKVANLESFIEDDDSFWTRGVGWVDYLYLAGFACIPFLGVWRYFNWFALCVFKHA